MGIKGKIFKVKALFSQPINNGAGQGLKVNKGDIGTFQVINDIGMGEQPVLLINVSFNGQSIHIQSKGYVDPNISYDETLKQMLVSHDNGKSPAFQILPNYKSYKNNFDLKSNFNNNFEPNNTNNLDVHNSKEHSFEGHRDGIYSDAIPKIMWVSFPVVPPRPEESNFSTSQKDFDVQNANKIDLGI
jgi:hypothetical protein